MQNLAINFLQYLRGKSSQIHAAARNKAQDCLCDYLAVAEAGALSNQARWTDFCRHVPVGAVPLIGMEKKTDGKTACLVNGYNAHSLELDDGQRFAMIHLGASVITAVEAACAENAVARGNQFKGIIMGYEAACRVAMAVQPAHKKKGFHTAGTCGTIGAAIGVAYALGMTDRQMETVLACAVTSSAGMLEIQEQRSELKPYNLGRAAMDGLAAAYMGFTDFLPPDDILNGERGFLNLFGDGGRPEKSVEETDYFEIERIYVKPYAACRHCHPAIEAALALREQCHTDAIEKIEVETYKLAVEGHAHTEIEGVPSAKLSIPYSVAVAFIVGRADIAAFTAENVGRADIMALTKRVRVAENEEFSMLSTQKRIAQVRIFLKNGQTLAYRVDYAKGEPENPMGRDEIKEKAAGLLGKQRSESVFKTAY